MFCAGKKQRTVCGIFVQENLYGCGIAYTITSAVSVRFTNLPFFFDLFLCVSFYVGPDLEISISIITK